MSRTKAPAPVAIAMPHTEMRELGTLRPHPKNPNKHPASQIDALGKSFDEFSITSVIVVDDEGLILAGHARVETGLKKGFKALPAIVVSGWSEAKKAAFMISDNQQSRLSMIDDDLLRENLLALQGSGIDFLAMGFDSAALAAALSQKTSGLVDPDDAPPIRSKPAVRLGDVWILGDHRVVCGDATKKETIAALLAKGEKPNLTVTDPPYGVNYDPSWRDNALKDGANRATGNVANDGRANWEEVWRLLPGDVAYVWGGGLHSSILCASLEVCGFVIRAEIVWVKTRPSLGRGNYRWQHEMARYVTKPGTDDHWRFVEEHNLAAYAVREGATHSWAGDRKQSTVWFIEHLKNDTGHGTQKPVECMRRPILNNSDRGALVLDPFLGSGTTLIACEMEGRCCRGIEIDESYVQVVIERWQTFTGRVAVLEGSGKTLEQMAKARRAGTPSAAITVKKKGLGISPKA